MKHIIEFQEVGVDKKIKHPVDMNMPMPKKNILLNTPFGCL